MGKGIFITGTGTEIGKTYVTGLLVKKLRELGFNAGYYKAALSGAKTIAESDAGYVNRIADIKEEEHLLLSYLYENAVSPHLAAKIEGNPVEMDKVKADFAKVANAYSYVVAEGSGGIVCPIRWDDTVHILLEDVILALGLDTLLVADAGLGTINAVALTVEYMLKRNIVIRGILLNNYTGGIMQEDNVKMIEEITGIKVIALIKSGDTNLEIDESVLRKLNLFKEEAL